MCWALGSQTDHSQKANSGRKGHGETWRGKGRRLGHGGDRWGGWGGGEEVRKASLQRCPLSREMGATEGPHNSSRQNPGAGAGGHTQPTQRPPHRAEQGKPGMSAEKHGDQCAGASECPGGRACGQSSQRKVRAPVPTLSETGIHLTRRS